MKLAVFVDQCYWFDGEHYSTDMPFIRFIAGFEPLVDQIVLCGRVVPGHGRARYALNAANMTVSPLPYYDSIYALAHAGARVVPEAAKRFWAGLDDWDVVWLGVPHPLALVFAALCHAKGKPYFLVVRQNLVEQVRHRSSGAMRLAAMATVRLLEASFQGLAKRQVTFAVGREMYELYKRQGHRPVYETYCSLMTRADLATARESQPAEVRGSAGIRLLSVGRLDPEKGLSHLLDALAAIRAELEPNQSVELVVAGTGRELPALQRQAQQLGVTRNITFAGHVANGVALFELYKSATVFVLPSLTGEGLPQVLLEAMAWGVPVVATRVAGIPYLIHHEVNGLLVDPAQPRQLAAAILRLHRDRQLASRCLARAREDVASHSLEDEVAGMVEALRRHGVWPAADAAA